MKKLLIPLLVSTFYFLLSPSASAADSSFSDLNQRDASGVKTPIFRTFIDPGTGYHEPYIKLDGALGVSTVTPHTLAVAASASGTIPSGAKGFLFVALTGTVTLGGQTMPVGLAISTNNTLGSSLAYTTASSSSAWLYYED